MKHIIAIVVLILINASIMAQQTGKTFQSNSQISYLLSLPEGYQQTGEASPLLLFLHGSGERGNDLEKVKVWGPPKLINEGKKLPFIVVSPQCPAQQHWDVYLLKQLLDDLIKTYNVDKSRIYLTGLSMGGYGTWDLATAFPNYFAAIVPVCGGGDPKSVYKIKDIPCWVFHGKKDQAVPEQRSAEMVKALKKLKADVLYTVLPEGDHPASWKYAYNEADLWKWFLKYSKKEK